MKGGGWSRRERRRNESDSLVRLTEGCALDQPFSAGSCLGNTCRQKGCYTRSPVVASAFMPVELNGVQWVIGWGSPADDAYWTEQAELDRWMDAGCPPPEEWLGKGSAPDESKAATEDVPIRHRLAVTKEQAGLLLGGKSVDWIEDHVLPNVKTVKPSRSVLIPTAELERWMDENSGFALGDRRHG